MSGGRNGTAPRTVTRRALAILESFSPERPELSLAEISRRTGLSASTTHRLLVELVDWGALERRPDLRYRIGRRLCEVAALSARREGLLASAMPFLDDLFEATGQTVGLTVLEGTEVVSVAQLAAGPLHAEATGGDPAPLRASAAGLVLLSYLSPPVRQAVAATSATGAVPLQTLERVVAEIHAAGVAITNGQYQPGTVSVAAPVFGPADTAVAALSLTFPARGAYPLSYVPAVRVASRGVSRALGARRQAPGAGAGVRTLSDLARPSRPPGHLWPGRNRGADRADPGQ